MGSNKSYWIKPAKRTVTPTHLVSVSVASRPAPGCGTGNKTPLIYGRAGMASAVLRGGRWRDGPVVSPVDAPSLLRAVEAAAPPRGSVLVVCPVASHVLTLAGFLPELVRRGAKWSGRAGSAPGGASSRPPGQRSASAPPTPARAAAGGTSTASDQLIVSSFVDRGKPDIIRYHANGRTVTWISGVQFFSQSEASLAELVGLKYEYTDAAGPVADSRLVDPADRARLWLRVWVELCTWWREIDGGPIGPTPASSAWNFVRKRLSPKTVLSCQEPDIRRLEELSLFGGEATTWHYAPVAPSYQSGRDDPELTDGRPYPVTLGPIDHYDVSSMYPTLLATERFPTRYLYRYEQPSIAGLIDMLERWCVIASVVVRTDAPDYPVRRGDRVIHPTGTFHVTLTTPDLRHALASGHVVRVVRAVTYAGGRPFAAAVAELVEHRRKADAAGRPVWAMFAKLLGNSFGGRMAMRSHGWKRAPGVHPTRQWGEWLQRDAQTGAVRRFRSRGGLVDVWEEVGTPTRPLAACFAHLTAYGRSAMRALRASLPPRSVVSQDTDGVWLLRHKLTGRTPAGTIPGSSSLRLRLTESSTSGRWYGPRHYRVDSGWTLAGLHDPRRWCDGLSWIDSYSQVPKWTADKRPPVWVYECERRVRLGEIPADGTVGPDGWLTPYHLIQE